MNILIHRPDKWDNPKIDKDLLYYPNGKHYKEEEVFEHKHPLSNIYRPKITSSFVEVEH